MSLINDALKKAQKQRTGDSPVLAAMPGVGGESASKIAKRDKPAGFNAQLMRLALGAGGVLLVVVAVGYFALRATRRPATGFTPVPVEAKPATDPAAAPGLASPKPGEGGSKPPASSSSTPAVTFTLPIAPPAAPVSSITASAGSEAIPSTAGSKPDLPVEGKPAAGPAPVTQTAAAPVPAKAEPAKSPSPPAKLDSKSITFIENLRIAGIRASATDSKVLMNDRVYRVGDIVEHDLGLKLTGITASSLSFEDERGARYTRSF